MTAYTAFRSKKTALRRWLFSASSRLILGVLAAGLGVFSLVKMSVVSTAGYDIAALERQIRALEEENRRLEFSIAHYRSMGSIQERLAVLNFVPLGEVSYISVAGNTVARR